MRKRTSPDRIAAILRDIRADLDAGLNVNQACRKAGINPTTYYRWKALQEDPGGFPKSVRPRLPQPVLQTRVVTTAA